MKKNFLPCLADPLHEASQHFAYSPAQRKPSSGWAGASNSSWQRHQKSVGNVAAASLCFDKRGSNRRAKAL